MAIGKSSKISKVFVWIILILIMVGLVGFGATGISGNVRSIGKVGDAEISVNQYARELDQELRALQAQTGQTFSLNQARAFGLDQAVLQRLVGTAAIDNETMRIGLSVGDERVRDEVLAAPAFQGLNGSFDREAYEFTLDRNGMTPAEYEDSIRINIARSLLQSAVAGGVVPPQTFTESLLNYIGERRNFSWVELDKAALDEPLGEPSDEDLQAYYDANIDDFTLPETKKLTYVWLSPEDVIDDIEIDEQALRDLYQERNDEFNLPERRLVERLVFGSQDEATNVLVDINAGNTTFEDIVAARGLNLADIDLGDVTQSALGDAGEQVFGLTEPGLVGPIETNLGPALFRVNAILAEQSTPFEDARDDLREELAADRARRVISDQITELDDLLAGGATLEELGSETEMTLGTLDWVEGADEGIAAYVDFNRAAAEIMDTDFPEIIELDDGGIFALRVDEIVAPRPEPFDQAVVRVVEDWEVAETLSKLTVQAEALQAQLQDGARLGALGLVTTVETHVTRGSFIEGTPPEFLEAVFEMEVNDSRVVQGDGSVLLVQLSDVLPPDTEDPDAAEIRSSLDDATAQALSQDILESFTRAMEAQGGITLDQNAINAIHTQFP